MTEKVKMFFESGSVELLEEKVNKFLLKSKCKLIREHYATLINENGWGNSVMIVYLPEDTVPVLIPKSTEEEVKK